MSNIYIVVGSNGSGKTSLLKSIEDSTYIDCSLHYKPQNMPFYTESEETIEVLVKYFDLRCSRYRHPSLGEQALLLLFLRLIEDTHTEIVCIDLPELGLHIAWQLRLINVIKEIKPNLKIIIATHSPAIFSKGYNDRIYDLDALHRKWILDKESMKKNFMEWAGLISTHLKPSH
jgi:predicted ATP-binding protein involved in virulence